MHPVYYILAPVYPKICLRSYADVVHIIFDDVVDFVDGRGRVFLFPRLEDVDVVYLFE